MKVIYSIGAGFAQGGIGETSYNAVSGVYRHGHLKKLLAISHAKTEIDENLIKDFPSPAKIANWVSDLPYLWKKSWIYPTLKNTLFDSKASKEIKDCDIFHGWAGFSLKQIERAKKIGAITMLDRASAHIRVQNDILQEEFDKFGIKTVPIPVRLLKRELQEYDAVDYILVSTTFPRDTFIKMGFPAEKIKMVNLGTNLERFEPGEKSKKFQVVFVGSIQLRKGLHYLLEAWRKLKLKDAELVVCGGYFHNIEHIINPLVSDGVRMLGHVNPVPYLKSAHVAVCPTLEDGYPLAVLEGMASGTAEIVTENTGAKDLVREGKDGFTIPIRDVDAIMEKILFFYNDRDAAVEMGASAREEALKYPWYNYGESLVKTYEEVMREKGK